MREKVHVVLTATALTILAYLAVTALPPPQPPGNPPPDLLETLSKTIMIVENVSSLAAQLPYGEVSGEQASVLAGEAEKVLEDLKHLMAADWGEGPLAERIKLGLPEYVSVAAAAQEAALGLGSLAPVSGEIVKTAELLREGRCVEALATWKTVEKAVETAVPRLSDATALLVHVDKDRFLDRRHASRVADAVRRVGGLAGALGQLSVLMELLSKYPGPTCELLKAGPQAADAAAQLASSPGAMALVGMMDPGSAGPYADLVSRIVSPVLRPEGGGVGAGRGGGGPDD